MIVSCWVSTDQRVVLPRPARPAGKVVMMRQPNPLSSYDLACLALSVLMERDGADSDGALDALLELAIRRGERLEVTAGLVVARAEIAGAQ